MDIIKVAQSNLKSILDEATFEINACLEHPTTDGALDRLSKAVMKYAYTKTQMETLFKLQGEVQKSQQQEEAPEEPKKDEA